MFSIRDGVKNQVGEEHNIITSPCLAEVAKAICGQSSLGAYYSIKWCALGDDDTAVSASDTTLGNEVFRTQYVSRNYVDNVATGDFYVTDTEFSGDIEEMGIFGGTQATATTDSGGMVSHVLWSYSKTSSEELVIEYEITVT